MDKALMQMKFKYVSHTADEAFIAYGPTFEAAIENAVLAMLGIALDTGKLSKGPGAPRSILIKEKAATMNELAWFILQDILTVRDARSIGAYKFDITKLSKDSKGYSISGKLWYKPLREDYMRTDIKAVPAYGLKVSEGKKGYSINAVIDI
jgi:SHS2 domain-containing protein